MSTKKLTLKIAKKEDETFDNSSHEDRQRIRRLFVEILDEHLGSQCEQALYDLVKKQEATDFSDPIFKREYQNLSYNLIENIDPDGSVCNTTLRPRILSGEITPEQLVRMNNRELYPDKWEQIDNKRLIEIKNLNEQTLATTDLYKCGKCRHRECTFYQLQTRSADEPITTFIKCVNCNNRWKE